MSELASMTQMMKIIFITRDDTGANKFGQSFTPKMTETTMPNRSGGSEECGGGWWIERVEVARAIALGDHVPGLQILHRKTKRIKLDGAVSVGGKATNEN